MLNILASSTDSTILYAAQELQRFLTMAGYSDAVINANPPAAQTIHLLLSPEMQDAICIDSADNQTTISGITPTDVLHGVYVFLEQFGVWFEFSGTKILPGRTVDQHSNLPTFTFRHTPSIPERGIRMHLNFVQDPSCFTEAEFSRYIDDLARMKFNYLLFHMYTPQEWYPFSYKGLRHLEVEIGNLGRAPLDPEMIGREKIKVQRHWYPADLEGISDPNELIAAMCSRYQRMMRRARTRGMKVAASIEPEALPAAFEKHLPEWSASSGQSSLTNDWQKGWSGTNLADADVRNPVVLDIAVERCLALLDAFPDLNELQLISREGTAWKQETFAAYATEFERIRQRFGLPEGIFNLELMSEIVVEDPQSIEMNPKAHPYWTVLPGDDYLATCCGSIRFIEFALDILNDPRLAAALNQRGVQPSLAIYSPNPKTIQLITPGVAAMLPEGMKISYLADYGARDITDGLDNWRPLFNGKRPVQMISWLEFDGCMMLTQSWCHSLDENVKKAHRLGVKSIGFNHWRVRSLEHNAWVAASACFDANKQDHDILHAYCTSLYGGHALQLARDAYAQLEQATLFTKRHTYNIGFTTSWVFHQSTEPPGYSWTYLEQAVQQYTWISALFDELSSMSAGWGRQQALYLRDLCRISAGHIQAVFHLQNAKLPLVGFKAWPLGNLRAAWPAPELLEVLYAQAEKALRLEEDYMRVYSQWVETCDEQGQLAMHQQGVIEPFRLLAEVIQSHLPRE